MGEGSLRIFILVFPFFSEGNSSYFTVQEETPLWKLLVYILTRKANDLEIIQKGWAKALHITCGEVTRSDPVDDTCQNQFCLVPLEPALYLCCELKVAEYNPSLGGCENLVTECDDGDYLSSVSE